MAKRQAAIQVDLSGPFFTRDPGKTVKGNIRRMMIALGDEGDRAVSEAISGLTLPHSTGWTLDHVVGRAHANSGNPWWLTAVISANSSGMSAKDAIRTKAAAASIERRFHPFRRVNSALRRSRAVLAANLTEGLK
jgi:hypothetical protein